MASLTAIQRRIGGIPRRVTSATVRRVTSAPAGGTERCLMKVLLIAMTVMAVVRPETLAGLDPRILAGAGVAVVAYLAFRAFKERGPIR